MHKQVYHSKAYRPSYIHSTKCTI